MCFQTKIVPYLMYNSLKEHSSQSRSLKCNDVAHSPSKGMSQALRWTKKEFLNTSIILQDLKTLILLGIPILANVFIYLGKNEEKIRAFFTDELILFFESNKQYHIEASKVGLLIFSNERLASVKEMKALAYFGSSLRKIIKKC